MYQLEHRPAGSAVSSTVEARFLRTCSSTDPTPATLALVRNTAALLRAALYDGNLAPLRDVVILTTEWKTNPVDIFAAAQQVIVDSLSTASAAAVHSTWHRLCEISREVLPYEPFEAHDLEDAFTQHALVG